jgi:hypothetical protein
MPRFRVKDLLIAMTLATIGGTMAAVVAPMIGRNRVSFSDVAPMYFAAGWGIAGMGVMYPFRRLWLGFLLGEIAAACSAMLLL